MRILLNYRTFWLTRSKLNITKAISPHRHFIYCKYLFIYLSVSGLDCGMWNLCYSTQASLVVLHGLLRAGLVALLHVGFWLPNLESNLFLHWKRFLAIGPQWSPPGHFKPWNSIYYVNSHHTRLHTEHMYASTHL